MYVWYKKAYAETSVYSYQRTRDTLKFAASRSLAESRSLRKLKILSCLRACPRWEDKGRKRKEEGKAYTSPTAMLYVQTVLYRARLFQDHS